MCTVLLEKTQKKKKTQIERPHVICAWRKVSKQENVEETNVFAFFSEKAQKEKKLLKKIVCVFFLEMTQKKKKRRKNTRVHPVLGENSGKEENTGKTNVSAFSL